MKLPRQFAFVLPALLLLVPLAVYLYNTLYIRYLADDFCVWGQSVALGPLRSAWWWYRNWTGRFMTFIVMGYVSPRGFRLAELAEAGMLIAWCVGTFAVLQLVARRWQLPSPARLAAVGTALLILTTLTGSIDVYQAVYFQGRLFTYIPPLVLFVFLVWAILQQRLNLVITLVLCGVLAFAASGFSDMFGLAQSAILAVACVICLHYPALIRRLVAALVGSALGLLLVLIAPGNAVREATFPTPNLGFAVSASIVTSPAPLLVSALLSPAGVLALIIFSALAAYYLDSRRIPNVRRLLLLIPLAIVTLSFVCSAPSYYFTSAKLSTGAWIVPQFFTLCGVMAWGYTLGLWLRSRQHRPVVMRAPITALCALLLIVVAATGLARALEVNHRLNIYATAWDQRDVQLRAETHDSTATVAVPLLPDSFELTDIASDINDPFNYCFARFYNIHGLIVPRKP